MVVESTPETRRQPRHQGYHAVTQFESVILSRNAMHLEDCPDVFVIDTDISRFPAPETRTVEDFMPEGETELVHLGCWFCS